MAALSEAQQDVLLLFLGVTLAFSIFRLLLAFINFVLYLPISILVLIFQIAFHTVIIALHFVRFVLLIPLRLLVFFLLLPGRLLALANAIHNIGISGFIRYSALSFCAAAIGAFCSCGSFKISEK